MKRLALGTLITVLFFSSDAALAQPSGAPYFDPMPAPPLEPATLGQSPMSHEEGRVLKRSSRGVRFGLDATAGYAYFRKGMMEDHEVHGPVVNASITTTWDFDPFRAGFRLHAMFAPKMEGEVEPFMGELRRSIIGYYGIYLGVLGEYKGLWGSVSMGVFHFADRTSSEVDTSPPAPGGAANNDALFVDEGDDTTLPEFVTALGYDLWFNDRFALRISGELGTFFFLSWRFSGTAGAVVRF